MIQFLANMLGGTHRRLWMSAVLALSVILVGCQTKGRQNTATTVGTPKTTTAAPQFIELNLLLMPMPLNLDSDPFPDAVAVQVFAVKRGKAKGSSIQKGKLEIILLDGTKGAGSEDIPPILKTWEYTPDQLTLLSKEGLLGVGYEMLLLWDKDKAPQQKKVTVLARYNDPNGQVLYSEPGIIMVRE